MNRSDYVVDWQKKNPERVRMHKRKYYYRNKKVINTMFSKYDPEKDKTGVIEE